MKISLPPGLLLAMPKLADPTFFHSVVLLCAHAEEGAFGFVLNQDLELPIQHVFEQYALDWVGDLDATTYYGGPVDPHHGWVLGHGESTLKSSIQVTDDLFINREQDGLNAYANEPHGDFRLLLGHAGWGAGQLDDEIEEGFWLPLALDAPLAKLLFRVEAERMWASVLAFVGLDPEQLTQTPGIIH